MINLWKKLNIVVTVIIVFIAFACTTDTKTPKATITEEQPATSTPDDSNEITPTVEPTSDETETSESSREVKAEANRNNVFTITLEGDRESLRVPDSIFLDIGEGVDVDNDGHAFIRFSEGLLTVEVLRDGELTLQEVSIDEQNLFISLLQRFGTFFNDFNPNQDIERRLRIETDFAVVTATGTNFLIASEANSPLEWIVGVEASGSDLQVTALTGGETKDVVSGQARWIAPIGEASPGIEANMGGIDTWFENLSAGMPVREIGEVVFSAADLVVDTENVVEIPPPGEAMEFDSVQISTDEVGNYELIDCNNDNKDDISIESGMLTFDFTNVLNRVQTLDITIINNSRPGSGKLLVFNPAFEIIDQQSVSVGTGEGQVLVMRVKEPIHYAQLAMVDGCFLGFSLTPPEEEPRSSGADMVEIANIIVEDRIYIVKFTTFGFVANLPGQHVHFFFDTVPPEQAGVPGQGPWIVYGGPSPFTEYNVTHRPENATKMCILVANPDHSVQRNSGNCFKLPPYP
jgi:hypothetical protein